MTKSRVVFALMLNAALTYGCVWLVEENVKSAMSAWALTLLAASFALGVSSWRAVRALLVLASIGSIGAVVLASTSLGSATALTLVALSNVGVLWLAWRAAPNWVKRNRYQVAPQNPWTALDQGIDPTE